jgi:hypothetical protein
MLGAEAAPAPITVSPPAAEQQQPSALTHTGPEEWQQNEFWDVHKPGALAPLPPTRSGAWRKTTDKLRTQLEAVLPAVVSEPKNTAERVKLAKAVRTACQLAFDARSYTALRSSIASMSAFWTAGLIGAALAVVACVRWDLAPLQVLVLLGDEAAFLAVYFLFERYAFPGVLDWGFGSERWWHTARLYGRTVVYLVVGVCAMVAVLTLADRSHRLTWLERVGLVAPLGCLAVVLGLRTAVGVQARGHLVKAPLDPYPKVITSLLYATFLLLQAARMPGTTGSLCCAAQIAMRSPARLSVPRALCIPIPGMCARVDAHTRRRSPALCGPREPRSALGFMSANWKLSPPTPTRTTRSGIRS